MRHVARSPLVRILRAAALLALFTGAMGATCRPPDRPEDTLGGSGRASRGSARSGSHAMRGVAVWYGARHHGRKTASGQPFDMNAMTAAHRTLRFGTRVRVIDQRTGRSVVVRINDRGPYGAGRVIDLSRAAASKLGILKRGKATVRLEIVR
jgi:rare lipoprotein A